MSSDEMENEELTCDSSYSSPEDDFFENPEKELQLFELQLEEFSSAAFHNYQNKNQTKNSVLADTFKTLEELQKENLELKEKHIKMKNISILYENEISILKEKLPLVQKEMEEITSEMESLISDYAHVSLDVNKKLQSLKETYNAHNYASKCFKTSLEIYLEIDKKDDKLLVTLNYFTTNANYKEYSLRLLKDEDKNKWELQGTTPEIPAEQLKQLQEQLLSTNNVVPVICAVRNKFIKMQEGSHIKDTD